MGSANYNFIECSPSDELAAVIASCPSLTLQGFEEETRKRMYQSYEEEDEFCDEAGHVHVEKKRRLSIEQVKSLERSFEVENKLEPDRKIQLAKELGLQPRQIAVWFQNRRARWKTKQLEKDYDALKSEYEDLKLSYIDLQKDRDRLQTELTRLRERLCTDEPKQAPSCEIGCSRVKIEEPLNEIPVIQSVELAPDYICKLQRPQIETMYKKEGSLSSESEASEVSQAESPTGNLNESLNTPSISHNYTYQQQQQQVQHQNAGLYVGSLDDYRTIPRAFAYRAEDQQDLFWSPW